MPRTLALQDEYDKLKIEIRPIRQHFNDATFMDQEDGTEEDHQAALDAIVARRLRMDQEKKERKEEYEKQRPEKVKHYYNLYNR